MRIFIIALTFVSMQRSLVYLGKVVRHSSDFKWKGRVLEVSSLSSLLSALVISPQV